MSASTALVAAQFAAIALLLWLGRAGAWSVLPTGLVAAGVALGLWALAANPPGNFNVRPEPRAGSRLATAGPYRWIRHPMYSALLMFGAAFALRAGAAGWLAWLALATVLRIKSRVEERALLASRPDYAPYRSRTRAFVPWLF